MITVSILVPIYGVEKYIERCVISLMEQSYNAIEYIFVNDCTKDNSLDILNKTIANYPSRLPYIKVINHQKNMGLAAARNTAIDASSGDYLLHVDSDDWLDIYAIEKLVNCIIKDKSDVVLFGNYNVYNDHKTESRISYENKEQYICGILRHTIPASIWNKIINANFYKNSGIRSIEGINHGEDYVVVPRLLHKAKSISVLNEPLYYYNLTNQSSYTKNITLTSIQSIHNAFEVVYGYFSNIEDKEKYAETIHILPLRSMLALTKKASRLNYQDIIDLYSGYFSLDDKHLSKSDQLIFWLLKKRLFSVLSICIKFYRLLKQGYRR